MYGLNIVHTGVRNPCATTKPHRPNQGSEALVSCSQRCLTPVCTLSELIGAAGDVAPVGVAAGADQAGRAHLIDRHRGLLVWSFKSHFHLITSLIIT